MKKKLIVLALAAIVLATVSGCGKKAVPQATPTPTPTATPTPTPDPITVEINNYLDTYVNTDKRPIAVMVDNDNNNARPQAGLDEAYLVYEMPVEGGATRFMALFRNTATEKIGPVRSSRHYFLDYAKENDVIYTHYGWSPKASNDISALGINNINGIKGTDSKIFWRERKYKGDWHSAYTSIEKISEMATKKSYKTETEAKNGINYSKEYINLSPESPATDIKLSYSGMYKTGYTYNAETGEYEKYINNEPHKMQNDKVLSFKNVIVELIGDKSLGDGSDRREIITTGSGKGYYFTNGAYEEITWSKESRTAPTVYTRADGTELLVNPGDTMINIINPEIGVVIQ